MSRLNTRVLGTAALVALAGFGCRRGVGDQGQIGASVGELMASADESASNTSTAAAVAASGTAPCYPFTFSACSAGVRTETFSSCTFGKAVVDGAVTLTFSDTANCAMAATGDSVNRSADFTVTGPYGGTLTVNSPGGGQTLTRTASGFDFAVPGMERLLLGPRGATLFDITTETTTPLSITGSSRSDFTIASGALLVTHHVAGYSVALTPDNLAWSPSCNCAVSGKLTGRVIGGPENGNSATVTITGCGTADVDIDGDSESVTMDRCVGI